MDENVFFESLPVPVSEEQRLVILADDKATLVNASAGSGKTTTIIIKMLYQINVLGYDPNSILAITFSKNAQQDMLNRYDELAQNFESRSEKPRFKTFHSLFLNLLGITNVPLKVCDPHRFYKTLLLHLKKVPVSDKWDTLDEMLQVYGKLVNNDLTSDGIHDKDGFKLDLESILYDKTFSPAEYVDIITHYQELKTNENSIDFDDMQLNLLSLLESETFMAEEIRRITHETFSQCYIDEFQDINALQIHILNELFKYKDQDLWNHTCVIGDPNQAIYAFRGSDSRFILNFENSHSNVQKFYLTTNYRCPNGILAPVLPLVNQKGQVTAYNNGGNVTVLKTYNAVFRKIKELSGTGSNAIIVRKHSSAVILVDKLARAGIQVKINDKHELLLENNYYKDLMNLIRLADTYDNKLLAHFLYPIFMLGHGKVSPDFNYKNVISMPDAYEYFVIEDHGNVDPEVVMTLDKIRYADDAETKINVAIDLLRKYHRYSKDSYLIKQINHYLTNDLIYDEDGESKKFTDFERENVLLTRKLREWGNVTGEITVLTSHAVKGLEFDNVFYVDVNNDILLNHRLYNNMLKVDNYADFQIDFEEERNLFYVSWTRAKKHLYINFVPKQQVKFFDELGVKYDPSIRKQHWTALKYANELRHDSKLGHAKPISKQDWNSRIKQFRKLNQLNTD